MAVNAETVERGPNPEASSHDEASVGSGWFRADVLGQDGGEGTAQSTEPQANEGTPASSEAPSAATIEAGNEGTGESPDSSQGSTPNQSRTFTITEDQLNAAFAKRLESELSNKYISREDVDRLVQSETDRRLAVQKRKDRAENRRRLREEDPVAFLELDKQEEQEAENEAQANSNALEVFQRTAQTIRDTTEQYDANVLTPLMLRLPATDRAELDKLATRYGSDPLEHRKQLTIAAVQAIERNAEKRAEQKLRNNDAFRKSLLLDAREQEEEPELIQGAGAAPFSGGFNMTNEIRNMAGYGSRRR